MTRRIVILNALLAAIVTVAAAQQILINAAGATFPNPMYSKWFSEYATKTGYRPEAMGDVFKVFKAQETFELNRAKTARDGEHGINKLFGIARVD